MQSSACLIGLPPAIFLMSSTHVSEVYEAVPIAPYFIIRAADFDEQTAIGAYPDLRNIN